MSTTQATAAAAGSPDHDFLTRERSGSRDFSTTDEWDASKTPPSRFQKRKGSLFATPSSRDGHVERNRDAVGEFHKAHSKRWSMSKEGGQQPLQPHEQPRRKSSTASAGEAVS